ncbi:hypothetical protein M9194_04335 [Vibrio sp. S4M6]|uniref:hypothetical protein n=1 Tax=Vibrio sinus TaxID=2946865 RepID=UPI00202A82AD|nr:hypothetical protein [Vibrio sinus]MCL9780664.1 hypothetical protein [Vibrio sinus]
MITSAAIIFITEQYHHAKNEIALNYDQSTLNDLFNAAARYAYYCKTTSNGNVNFSRLQNKHFFNVKTDSDQMQSAQKDIDIQNIRIRFNNDFSHSGQGTTTKSVQVTLSGQLKGNPNSRKNQRLRHGIHAQYSSSDKFTIQRRVLYPTYAVNNVDLSTNNTVFITPYSPPAGGITC